MVDVKVMYTIYGTVLGFPYYIAGRAAAAAGQSGVMALYDNLFGLMDLQAAQVLVTSNDFTEDVFKGNLCATVEDLLSMNVVCAALPETCVKS